MTRKKVKLAFITNDASRKATYKKRKKGLLKKVSELSTLCGIEACAIIYSSYETQPEVWPNAPGAQRVISKFKRMPEMEQSKKMLNQESFIRQRIMKATEQLKKQKENNMEKEITERMYQCLTGAGVVQNLGMGELNQLGRVLDQNLKDIDKRIELLAKREISKVQVGMGNIRNSTGMMMHIEEQKPILDFGLEAMNRPQWFNDWVSNQNEQMGFGGGIEMMLPFGGDNNNNNNNNNNNATWSGAFFP